MERNSFKNLFSKTRLASALLMVVLALGILLILYFLITSAIFKPSRISKMSRPEDRPWLEEHRIVSNDTIIDLPDQPKPELNEDVSVTADVTLDGQNRGQLALNFDTQGCVSGFWKCSFLQENKLRTFEAQSQGNIDTSKTYTENEKQDASLLYFITKGTYTEMVENTNTKQVSTSNGIIYVTGYLNPEYNVFGQITITTDKSWSISYEFDSKL